MTRAGEFSVRQQTERLLRLEQGDQCDLFYRAFLAADSGVYLFTYLFMYLFTKRHRLMHESSRRLLFLQGLNARDLALSLDFSQSTISRALGEMRDEVEQIGVARSIQYALRDTQRGLPDFPVFRNDHLNNKEDQN
jgi:hypothetical protein